MHLHGNCLCPVAESGEDYDGDTRATGMALQTARPFDGTQLQDKLQLRCRWTPAQRCSVVRGQNVFSLADYGLNPV